MNLDPIMEYLRDIVLREIDTALGRPAPNACPPGRAESGRCHRADVVAMLEMRHGPDAIAGYLASRAKRLEGIDTTRPDERAFVTVPAQWCRRASRALSTANLFTSHRDDLAA